MAWVAVISVALPTDNLVAFERTIIILCKDESALLRDCVFQHDGHRAFLALR